VASYHKFPVNHYAIHVSRFTTGSLVQRLRHMLLPGFYHNELAANELQSWMITFAFFSLASMLSPLTFLSLFLLLRGLDISLISHHGGGVSNRLEGTVCKEQL